MVEEFTELQRRVPVGDGGGNLLEKLRGSKGAGEMKGVEEIRLLEEVLRLRRELKLISS